MAQELMEYRSRCIQLQQEVDTMKSKLSSGLSQQASLMVRSLTSLLTHLRKLIRCYQNV